MKPQSTAQALRRACQQSISTLPLRAAASSVHPSSSLKRSLPTGDPSHFASPPRTTPLQSSFSRSIHTSPLARLASAPVPQKKQCSNPDCAKHPALPLEALTCPSCSSLQPLPSSLDYYTLFTPSSSSSPPTLHVRWTVSPRDLKRTWRSLMALTHPDRMGGKPAREQSIAAQQSSLVNKAYETLLSPLPRLLYLVRTETGRDLGSDEDADGGGGGKKMDPELLMTVLQTREELEDASGQEAVDAIRAQNKERFQHVLDRLDKIFAATAEPTNAEKVDWQQVIGLAVQLRYWQNIEDACREWQPGNPIALAH